MTHLARLLACVAVLASASAGGEACAGEERGASEAREHFHRANAHYNAGRFTLAASEYLAAYALSPRPELLYNAAQASRLGGQAQKAIELYRRYLGLAPDGRAAPLARAQLATLAGEASALEAPGPAAPTEEVPGPPLAPTPSAAGTADASAPSTPAAPVSVSAAPAQVEPPPARRRRPAAWTMTGIAAATLASGLGLALDANARFGDLDQASSHEDYLTRRDRVEAEALAANVLFGVGAAASVTALVLFFVEGRTARRPVVSSPFGIASIGGRGGPVSATSP